MHILKVFKLLKANLMTNYYMSLPPEMGLLPGINGTTSHWAFVRAWSEEPSSIKKIFVPGAPDPYSRASSLLLRSAAVTILQAPDVFCELFSLFKLRDISRSKPSGAITLVFCQAPSLHSFQGFQPLLKVL